MCKLKNRYSQDGFWIFGQLRKFALVPAIFLFVALLSANAVAWDCFGHHGERNSQTTFYNLEGDQDLAVTPVENRELRSDREEKENTNALKSEIRLGRHQNAISTLLHSSKYSSKYLFPAETSFLSGIHLCLTTFAPRPPPLFSAQA